MIRFHRTGAETEQEAPSSSLFPGGPRTANLVSVTGGQARATAPRAPNRRGPMVAPGGGWLKQRPGLGPRISPVWISRDGGINLFMDRGFTRIGRLSDRRSDDFVPGTAESRIALVWPLTREIASLSRLHDAERGLKRGIAVPRRRGG